VSSPLCGHLTRYCFLFKSLGLEFALSLWGTLSDERSCLWLRVTLRMTVSEYVLVSSPLCGCLTRYCFLFKSLGLEFVLCGAPSLTRGRAQAQSHFKADSQSVCLGVEPTLWAFDQVLLPFQEFGSGICCPVCGTPSLTGGWVCPL
jgi:hypothetical protein